MCPWMVLAATLLTSPQPAANPLVGIYKPGIEHGKLDKKGQEQARKYKAAVEKGSMKLNADKSFGVSLAGRVMLGSWTATKTQVTITVKQIVGMTDKDVAKLPSNQRIARFKIVAGGKLVSLPEPKPGQPKLVWKKLP